MSKTKWIPGNNRMMIKPKILFAGSSPFWISNWPRRTMKNFFINTKSISFSRFFHTPGQDLKSWSICTRNHKNLVKWLRSSLKTLEHPLWWKLKLPIWPGHWYRLLTMLWPIWFSCASSSSLAPYQQTKMTQKSWNKQSSCMQSTNSRILDQRKNWMSRSWSSVWLILLSIADRI